MATVESGSAGGAFAELAAHLASSPSCPLQLSRRPVPVPKSASDEASKSENGGAQTGAVREEIYLRLPAPLQDYTITPWRPDEANSAQEAADLVELMNHPLVYPTLCSPPFPYLTEHGDWFVKEFGRQHAEGVAALLSASTMRELCKTLQSWPLSVIRYEPEQAPLDGESATHIGHSLGQCQFNAVKPDAALEEAVAKRGSPLRFGEKTWVIGYSLHPGHGTKGLMTGVLRAQMLAIEAICRLSSPSSASFRSAVSPTLASVPAPSDSELQALPTERPASLPRPRFTATVMTENRASFAVLRKCGLKAVVHVAESCGRKYGWKDGNKEHGVLPAHVLGASIMHFELEAGEADAVVYSRRSSRIDK